MDRGQRARLINRLEKMKNDRTKEMVAKIYTPAELAIFRQEIFALTQAVNELTLINDGHTCNRIAVGRR